MIFTLGLQVARVSLFVRVEHPQIYIFPVHADPRLPLAPTSIAPSPDTIFSVLLDCHPSKVVHMVILSVPVFVIHLGQVVGVGNEYFGDDSMDEPAPAYLVHRPTEA